MEIYKPLTHRIEFLLMGFQAYTHFYVALPWARSWFGGYDVVRASIY